MKLPSVFSVFLFVSHDLGGICNYTFIPRHTIITVQRTEHVELSNNNL